MTDRQCEMTLLLQAEFDGELDAAQSASLAAHREDCAICRANWDALAASRRAIEAHATRHRADATLRRAVESRIGAAPAAPTLRRARAASWRLGGSFVLGAALAAMLVLVVRPAGDDSLVAAIVDDHVRSLQPGHLMDVVSTDQHTVKPWFDGKLDFAPPVKDLASEGFPLTGGRLDYVDGRPVAALAYAHGKHQINLLIWPALAAAPEPASAAARKGYNLVHWRADGMTLWAVSDLERDQLEDFARLWQTAN